MPLSLELRAEIDTNDVAFAALEPRLLTAHTGHYVLMRHGGLVASSMGLVLPWNRLRPLTTNCLAY